MMAILLYTLTVSVLLFGATPQLPMSEIIEGLQKAEDAACSFELTGSIEARTYDNLSQQETKHIFQNVRFIIAADGRARFESSVVSSNFSPSPNLVTSRLAVFDGTYTREMEGFPKYERGSNWLIEQNGHLIGVDLFHKRPVIVVETDPDEACGVLRKLRFFIDDARDFTVVKRSTLFQFTPSKDWIEVVRTTGFDFAEVTSGVWLPYEIDYEEIHVARPDQQEPLAPHITINRIVKVDEWNLAPSLDDEVFHLDFPPALKVVVDNSIVSRNKKRYLFLAVATAVVILGTLKYWARSRASRSLAVARRMREWI
jgi:hypothetical protein